MALDDLARKRTRPRLSPRYERILELTLGGKSSVEIAREIGLSRQRVSWVKHHDPAFITALEFEEEALRETSRARLLTRQRNSLENEKVKVLTPRCRYAP